MSVLVCSGISAVSLVAAYWALGKRRLRLAASLAGGSLVVMFGLLWVLGGLVG